MERGRTIERIIIALLVVAVAWQTWAVRRARTNLERAVDRLDVLTERGRAYQEALEQRNPVDGSAPKVPQRPVVAAQAGAPNAAAAPVAPRVRAPNPNGDRIVDQQLIAERRPRRRKAPPLPGANALNRLYDAADQMAVREGWNHQTYDDVVLVFEDTAEEMKLLYQDLKGHQINMEQAREEVEMLRDDANGRLADVIGEDGLERLKTHILEDRPAQ